MNRRLAELCNFVLGGFILIKLKGFCVTQNETPKIVKKSASTNKLSRNFTEHVSVLFGRGGVGVYKNYYELPLREVVILSINYHLLMGASRQGFSICGCRGAAGGQLDSFRAFFRIFEVLGVHIGGLLMILFLFIVVSQCLGDDSLGNRGAAPPGRAVGSVRASKN